MRYELIADMFPDYLNITSSEITISRIIINFESNRTEMKCPDCGVMSNKYATYFLRELQDLPLIEKPLLLRVKLKKFRCINPTCRRKVFSESMDKFAGPKGRRTKRLDELLVRFSLLNTAEGAARLLKEKSIIVSGDTLLRLAMEWEPIINYTEVETIGIDDFAFKKNITTEQLLSTSKRAE